mmetsp:Transcript_49733/g.143092  ORF Transcript_49733/g.143092 Transcript_49733/m.143092 type:complete len:205 (+) Transcript_49733:2308-2922(+)
MPMSFMSASSISRRVSRSSKPACISTSAYWSKPMRSRNSITGWFSSTVMNGAPREPPGTAHRPPSPPGAAHRSPPPRAMGRLAADREETAGIPEAPRPELPAPRFWGPGPRSPPPAPGRIPKETSCMRVPVRSNCSTPTTADHRSVTSTMPPREGMGKAWSAFQCSAIRRSTAPAWLALPNIRSDGAADRSAYDSLRWAGGPPP